MFSILRSMGCKNSEIKKVSIFSLGIIFLMIIFPPYEEIAKSSGRFVDNGYMFLFYYQGDGDYRTRYVIDYAKLFLQSIGVLIFSFVYLFFKNNFKELTEINDNTKESEHTIDFKNFKFDKTIYNLVGKEEEDLFELAIIEIKDNKTKQGLWAKCLSETTGDEQKSKSLYITYRVKQLINEQNDQISKLKNNYHSKKVAFSTYCNFCKNKNVYIDVHNRPFCPDCKMYTDKP